jgi:aryl-alcohol dehydrogenase-like predicted oxidoreductase
MKNRRMGLRGPTVSVVGLGCTNFGPKVDESMTRSVVAAALDVGITHFDTAESYGAGQSEEYLGKALGSRRDEAVIATKFSARPPGAAQPLAEWMRKACEASLRRLGTDHIDVYYQHVPEANTPVEEVLAAFNELVNAGKVLHPALSNCSAVMIEESENVASSHDWAPLVSCEIEWNMLTRSAEAEVVPAAHKAGLGIVPYFPLASGMLTGKYRFGVPYPDGSRLALAGAWFQHLTTEENFERVERYRRFAEQRGHTMLELAIAWLVAQDGVSSVVSGATSPEQIRANAAAAEWSLWPEDLSALDEV